MGLFGKGKRVFDSTKRLTGTHSFQMQGKAIACPHCGGTQFDPGPALLNTAGMTFFDLDWANRSATVLVCTQCSHIQWFLREPEVTG